MTFFQGVLFFIAIFIQVFLMAFQSRNVNSGQYVLAGLTAFMINAINIFCIRSIVMSDPYTTFFIASSATPLGVMSAMFIHRHIFKKYIK